MMGRVKVQDIEISEPLKTIENLAGYQSLQGIVRLHGVPLGYIKVPVTNGFCSATVLAKTIIKELNWQIFRRLLINRLASPLPPDGLTAKELFDTPSPEYTGPYPLVTVAVCTRDRLDNLELCLESLSQLDYPALEVIVVDNAPTTAATEHFVKENYPNFRYVCEPRPGLDWARNRAIIEAQGEILAYTDDDVVVDRGWVKAIVKVFTENPTVMAVTGLTVPYELETEAQRLLELYGGFGRGFVHKWWRVAVESGQKAGNSHGGAGQYGAGANMAFRRAVFEQIGYFDPALDVGTVTNGGGDLEMFFRVLKEGHMLVYEPGALVRHRHRREYQKLWTQIHNNGIGLYSYFARSALCYPDERAGFRQLGNWWLRWWLIRRYLISLFRPTLFPRDLISAELKGALIGIWDRRYKKAQARAAQIEAEYGVQSTLKPVNKADSSGSAARGTTNMAIRTVDVTKPLYPLEDVTDYSRVYIAVLYGSQIIGNVEIANQYQPISKTRLIEAIADSLNINLLSRGDVQSRDALWSEVTVALTEYLMPTTDEKAIEATRLANDVSVSIVVGTYDRPDDLEECLQCLVSQRTQRPVEIIVVDNNPSSNITPPTVAKFPNVRLVNEVRKGVAYARNAGIIASNGEIIVTTDDDIIMSPEWLENLLAPFARADVMMVTSNYMPPEVETEAQHLFAKYDRMGRGHERFEVSGEWFESFRRRPVPTWILGGTGNAAYRASIFKDPKIGLMKETLGPGMPTGVGEDSYLFYKVVKAGHTIVYEPTAFVWHKYRREMSALYRQVYNYSKGHIAHHLTTIIHDRDFRGLVQICYVLPMWRIRQLIMCARGKSDYPLKFIWMEIKGNFAGPWALWQSYRRVKREGRSEFNSQVAEQKPNIHTLSETSTLS